MQYKIVLMAIFIICQIPYSYGQDTFIKKIDKDMTTLGYQIEIYENRIFILTGKVCNNIAECSTVMEIDEYGNVLWDKELPFLDVSSKSMVIENDTIFLSGNYNQTQQKFLFHQMSIEGGEPLATYDIVKPDDIYTNMFNLGMLKKDNKFYIYGPGEKDEGTIETTLIYVVDINGNLDTLLTLFPTGVSSDPWQMRVDNHDNLVVFIELDVFGWGEGKDDTRKIIKLNNDYEIIWSYTSEEDFYNRSHPIGLVLDDDRIVYVTGNENFNLNQYSLRAINLDSTISWQYYSPTDNSKHRIISRIKKASDGNILGFGEWGNKLNDPKIDQTPWIFKISKEGEMIWEHVYYELREGQELAKSGLFFDAVELDDGSILAVGGMRSDNNDILLARFDSEGCLMFGCTILTDVTDVLSDVDEVLVGQGIKIYPNPSQADENITVAIDHSLIIGGDYTLEVYNSMGKLVQRSELSIGEQNFMLDTYGKGLFFVRVKNKGKIIFSDKIIRL